MSDIVSVLLPTFIGGPCAGQALPEDITDEQEFRTYAGRGQRLVVYERAVFTHMTALDVRVLCVEAFVHDAIAPDHRSAAIVDHLVSAATAS